MRRLLASNYRRLFKCVWFWIPLMAIAGYVTFGLICEMEWLFTTGNGIDSGLIFSILDIFDGPAIVFVSLFVGVEYSNKTLRNKIIAGHSKTSVYASYWITCSSALLIMYIMVFGMFIASSISWGVGFVSPKQTFVFFVCGIFGVIAKASVWVAIAMLITREAVSFVLAFALLFISVASEQALYDCLSQPETIVVSVFEEGKLVREDVEENEDYIKEGMLRTVLENVRYCNIRGQEDTYAFAQPTEIPDNIPLFPVYSISISLVASVCGLILFKRKDLK